MNGRPTLDSPSAGKADEAQLSYKFSVNLADKSTKREWNTLIDRGANGGISGADSRPLEFYEQTVDCTGMGDHMERNLPTCVSAIKVRSSEGDIVAIFHHQARMPKVRTICSSGQMEHFGVIVNEKSKNATGEQPHLIHPSGIKVPLAIVNGLLYLKGSCPSDDDLNRLKRVEFTSPKPWDPSVLDSFPDEEDYVTEGNGDIHGTDPIASLSQPDDEETHFEEDDRSKKAIDRRRIEAFLTKIIQDELIDDVAIMDISDGYTYGETDGTQDKPTKRIRRPP